MIGFPPDPGAYWLIYWLLVAVSILRGPFN